MLIYANLRSPGRDPGVQSAFFFFFFFFFYNNNNIQFLETHNTIKNSLYACEKVNIKLKL